MPAADCERLLDGFLAQPVNAVSSLAFVLAGMSVFVRRRGASGRALVGAFSVTLIAVGIGSWAFHGPGGTTADWVHDASITALLVLIVSVELGYVAGWTDRQVVAGWTGTTTALWLVEWVWPSVGDTLNAPLALFAVLGVLAPQLGAGRSGEAQRPGTGVFVGLALLGVGAITMLLSRTGGPLCAPDSLVQGHAIWHMLAAAGISVYVGARLAAHPATESR